MKRLNKEKEKMLGFSIIQSLCHNNSVAISTNGVRIPVKVTDIESNGATRTTKITCMVNDCMSSSYPWPKTNPNITPSPFSIKKVIFNGPATIVYWADGTKTVVKAQPGEVYDREKGLAMAISKKALGNKGNYLETFKKWEAEDDVVKEKEYKKQTDKMFKEIEKKTSYEMKKFKSKIETCFG
jgi:hypothetical protein